jgi:hypothetical protein
MLSKGLPRLVVPWAWVSPFPPGKKPFLEYLRAGVYVKQCPREKMCSILMRKLCILDYIIFHVHGYTFGGGRPPRGMPLLKSDRCTKP